MKRWVWYVIAGVVFALAAGGVLYGVLTHKEPGLMNICWKGGRANYTMQCEALTWKKEQMPLTYHIDFGPDHKVYVDSVVAGANMWNKELCMVFKRVDKAEDAIIHVSWGAYESSPTKHDCSAGYTSHKGYSGPTGADVVLKNPSDVHAVYRYAAHEFGHVLGLAHDEATRSIMYPTQPDVTEDMTFVLPSDYDRKILKAALCQ